MEKILFVNSCPRERGVSRTLALYDAFISAYSENRECEVTEINLYRDGVTSYTLSDIEKRDRLISEKKFDDPMFDYARQFAAADAVIIAAPYWDLSFPSVLKAYIEMVCVCGITFKYTETGSVGLSGAKKLAYITSSGGFSEKKNYGGDYIRAVGEFLGTGEFMQCSAYGVDVRELNTDEIMEKAIADAAIAGSEW